MRFDTRAIHRGQRPDPTTGAIVPPLYVSSTYVQSAPGVHQGYEYARTQNPTRDNLEANLADLEGARFGVVFASGMAAETTLLLTLNAGDHVVCGRDVYGGTFRLFDKVFSRFGLTSTGINIDAPDELEPALETNTRLVWLETPSNPLLTITDIRRVAETAHAHGARVVIDNTFATPCLQRPLELGADFVVHSCTKYLGGHCDAVGGAVLTNDESAYGELKFLQNASGAILGPFDSFLIHRGVKTLGVRMRQHCQNAQAVAEYLQGRPEVTQVLYPGLEGHPGHALARQQMSGFGGMVSFVLHDGEERARRLSSRTRVFALAESLGGVESLICMPTVMTHASIPREERLKGGLSDSLLRLSVGLEDVEDLLEDLDQALAASK